MAGERGGERRAEGDERGGGVRKSRGRRRRKRKSMKRGEIKEERS